MKLSDQKQRLIILAGLAIWAIVGLQDFPKVVANFINPPEKPYIGDISKLKLDMTCLYNKCNENDLVTPTPEKPAEVNLEPNKTIKEPSVEELIDKYFGKDSTKAKKIAFCESGLNPERHNYNPKTKDDSYGLFQVNLWGKMKESRPSPEELKNPETNIKFAKQLFDSAGGFHKDWVNCNKKVK